MTLLRNFWIMFREFVKNNVEKLLGLVKKLQKDFEEILDSKKFSLKSVSFRSISLLSRADKVCFLHMPRQSGMQQFC